MVAGIIFLAVEIRQNNQILVEQARYVMLENQKDFGIFVNGDKEIARLTSHSPDAAPLDEIDQARRTDIIFTLLLIWQWEFEQSELGMFGTTQLP